VTVPPGVTVASRVLTNGKSVRTATASPAGQPVAVLVFFLGNFEDLRSGVSWAEAFASLGMHVIVQEYPGYGDSEGEPSVDALYAAAEELAKLARGVAESRHVPLIAAGCSLGTFSAVHVAAKSGVERLLLLAPPGSVAEVAKRSYWFFPVGLLLRHRFDTFAEASAVRCPTLVVHGDRDGVIPLSFGKRVAEALHGELIVAKGAGHNDLFHVVTGTYAERVRAFLAGK
jgi:pimeloyl-ACP methyl ester carboxylesterase